MSSSAGAFIGMCMTLGGVLSLLVHALVQNIRARRAARKAAECDRIDAIATMGFRSALMRGLVDERGNVISRVGYQDDIR